MSDRRGPVWLSKPLTVLDLGAMTPQPPICDFCGTHAPSTLYASRVMTDGTPQRCWRWAACPSCHQLIETERWDVLVSQMVRKLGEVMAGVAEETRRHAAEQVLGQFFIYAIRV